MMIAVTLPAKHEWEPYQEELDAVKDYSGTLNFKVPNMPKVKKGDICFLVWRGKIRGWMEIVGVCRKAFTCDTTGKEWRGIFIERSGPFHRVKGDYEMKGFQGYRYLKPERFLNKHPMKNGFNLEAL